MTRTSKEIIAELTEAKAELRSVERRVGSLETERDSALLAESLANPHPWLGKKVRRLTPGRYGRADRTNRGTVVAYNPAEHRHLRSLSTWGMTPGDMIVVHDGGVTGWNFEPRWSGSKEPRWELDE